MKTDHRTFATGYMDGWMSVIPGSVPRIPGHTLPAGKTPYEYGFESGCRAAAEHKEWMEQNPDE